MKKREMFIDIARGIALLLVIISHSNILNTQLNTFINSFYIPVFFFISGYMYLNKNIESKNYLSTKFKKTIAPYFIYSFIILLVFTVLKGTKNFIPHLLGIFYSRFCLFPYTIKDNINFMDIGSAPLWFLTSWVLTIIVFTYLMRLIKSKNISSVTIFVVGLLGTLILNKLPILLPWSIDTVLLMVLFMYCGYLIKEKNGLNIIQKDKTLILILVLLTICISQINGPTNISVREYGNSLFLYIMAGITGSIILILLSKYLENIKFIGNRIFAYIGENTIILLAFHLMCFYMIDVVFDFVIDINKFGSIMLIVYTLFKIIFSVIACCILNEIINKIKLIRKK